MRVLSIENHRVIIEVDSTELDNIINMIEEDQFRIGYGEGFNDYRVIHNADMDDDRTENNSQERDKGIV